jgi:hypothetical protein
MLGRPLVFALGLALAGCGLTLDLEPPEQRPDAAVSDFGVPKDHGGADAIVAPDNLGGPRDLGHVDLGTEPDLGRALDGGSDLGVVRRCEDGCLDTEFCETTLRVCLGTEGTCQPRPSEADCLGDPEQPVCGCDHRTYRNDCAAAAAGVVVALLDVCPDFGDDDDWCDLEPPAATVDGCVPCYDDADCMERTTTAFECVGSTCSAAGVGRCAFNLPLGRCYYDHDCEPDETCEDAILHGCEDAAGLVPVQGTCR